MKQELLFLEYEGFRLPYQKYGRGEELLFAFHGFGQSSEDYACFESALSCRYTIIAFDFFYHGEQALSPEIQLPPFTAGHLAAIIEQLLWEHRKVKCSLIGFSQGGRLVLGIIHRIPHRIHELFLIAPDGLKTDYLHKFIARTAIGRRIGWFVVFQPKQAFVLAKFLQKTGLLSRKTRQLMLTNMDSKEKRLKVYHTWLLLQNYHPDLKLVHHYLSTRPIRFELIFGKFDTVIPAKLGKRFFKSLRGTGRLHILDAGHQLLLKNEEICRIILNSGK